MKDINHILVIRLSSIGDILLTTPLLRGLRTRFPRARIDFVVKKQFIDLLANNPHIDTIFQLDVRKKYALKELHQEGQTIIMVTHNRDNLQWFDRTVYLRDGQVEKDVPAQGESLSQAM